MGTIRCPHPKASAAPSTRPWKYILWRPYVNYQADLPEFAKASYDAQQILMRIGLDDPADGFFSTTACGKGTSFSAVARSMNAAKLVKAWQREVGDTVRKGSMEPMAAAKA